MYEDDDDLELLRQYEEQDASDSESDKVDSDIEEKIMSLTQYGNGPIKKGSTKSSSRYSDDDSETEIKASPSKEKFKVHESSSSDDSDSDESFSSKSVEEIEIKNTAPKITRYIDLDTPKRYVEDESESEEERELSEKLQALIDDQTIALSKTKTKKNAHINICNLCFTPGHKRQNCIACRSCGLLGHSPDRCYSSTFCPRCKRRGHSQEECEFAEVTTDCVNCGSSKHISAHCPTNAHVYVGEIQGKKKTTPYCYYCGDSHHYGDECDMRQNLSTITPTVFSKYSLLPGGRYSKNNIAKHSASSFTPYQQGDHIRFPSPGPSDNQRNRDGNRGNNSRGPHSRDSGRDNNGSGELDNFFDSNRRKRPNPSMPQYQQQHKPAYQQNNDGKQKRHIHDQPLSTPIKKSKNNYNNRFDGGHIHEFTHQRPVEDTYHGRQNAPTGNNNWKALGGESMPRPTRSGTMNVGGQDNGGFVDYQADFPRNQRHIEILPRPSSSGVIDMPESSRARRPQYHGGYSKHKQ
ncbi:hypothetical protein CLU79DRAFT_745948 [Phycomyces nitens]|nr:hypothetical protein CLU79DRAFT_745948 [Phycomyces nitens]